MMRPRRLKSDLAYLSNIRGERPDQCSNRSRLVEPICQVSHHAPAEHLPVATRQRLVMATVKNMSICISLGQRAKDLAEVVGHGDVSAMQ